MVKRIGERRHEDENPQMVGRATCHRDVSSAFLEPLIHSFHCRRHLDGVRHHSRSELPGLH